MSKLHASPSGEQVSVPLEEAEEALTHAQQTTLRQGLGYAPLPRPHADFNAAVLATVQSGQDFDSVAEQAKTRLRWAALPAVIGFALMYGLACWQVQSLPPPPAPYPRVNHGQPAPPLPDLSLLSPGKSASAQSALPKSPSPGDTGAIRRAVGNPNSPSPGDAGAGRRGVGVRSQSAAMGEPRHDR